MNPIHDDNDRVRRNTDPRLNWRIDTLTESSVREQLAAGPDAMRRRLASLDREWDVERVLETLAPTLILNGIALSLAHNRRWLLLPTAVAGFLLQHAVQGWCPPLPVLRRLGVRTRSEIDRERRMLEDALQQDRPSRRAAARKH
ncbi:MAG: hypothetical protein ACPHN2_00235 [Sinimarinibacterium flocculans]|uniref:hypothetical protein n=1 Tax=Sinimarinibacterium flocculans TaxID=985250 RepID=UPI003C44526B